MQPRLSRLKEQAIERLTYDDAVRFMLQVKRRFWKGGGGFQFAGERISNWTGWMQEALESGERGAPEVLNATGQAWPAGPAR